MNCNNLISCCFNIRLQFCFLFICFKQQLIEHLLFQVNTVTSHGVCYIVLSPYLIGSQFLTSSTARQFAPSLCVSVWPPIGSFLFMTIEGGALDTHTILASTTSRQLHPYGSSAEDMDYVKYHQENHPHHRSFENITFSPAAMRAATEARHKTVENIWDITVSLNILYRDNWTR